ncbi:hypothetical protein CPB84DRAFT_1749001 [Gymnopilus junonius]|uniref:Uncharacterized protein n=1 Tax=Gymnopilus junonius TaxID=109634 RepID=A0A9P5TLS0_GYMJU|nr:hypothetical protein CPB84DRAFT_1749001 [Gymnopilus junonius]
MASNSFTTVNRPHAASKAGGPRRHPSKKNPSSYPALVDSDLLLFSRIEDSNIEPFDDFRLLNPGSDYPLYSNLFPEPSQPPESPRSLTPMIPFHDTPITSSPVSFVTNVPQSLSVHPLEPSTMYQATTYDPMGWPQSSLPSMSEHHPLNAFEIDAMPGLGLYEPTIDPNIYSNQSAPNIAQPQWSTDTLEYPDFHTGEAATHIEQRIEQAFVVSSITSSESQLDEWNLSAIRRY